MSDSVNINLNKGKLFILELLNLAGLIDSKTKLQKMMFLAKEENKVEHGYQFEKYLYGPFSNDISDDLKFLEQANLIEVTRERVPVKGEVGTKVSFKLSKVGAHFIKISEKKIFQKKEIDGLKKATTEWNSKPLDDVLAYVYKKYM